MSDEVKKIIINELIPRATHLELQGTGESLLYGGLEDIVNAASKNKCDIMIITNASLLNKEKMLMLVKARCQIIVSMDSPVKSTYEKIRVNGHFDKVCHNLDYWKYAKPYPSNKHRSCLNINMVLCSLNYRELIKMIDFAVDNHVDHLFISEVRRCVLDEVSWAKLTIEQIKKSREFKELIEKARQYAIQKELKIFFNFTTDIKKGPIRNICPSPWEHVFIFSSGEVSICCEISKSFGNLKKVDFKSIWNGKELNEFRSAMAVGNYDDKCKTCCLLWGITHG
jgi:MoaA/NifB/PqqE/SkfB family radical SAM enzyme